MEDFKNIQDELKELNSSLSGMEKKNNFSVPENYFEKFSSSVQDKISAEKKSPWWAGVFKGALLPKLSIATCVVVLVAGSIYYFNNGNDNSNVAQTNNSSTDFDASVLLSELDESTLADVYVQSITSETAAENADMENYLIENNIDDNSLINEL